MDYLKPIILDTLLYNLPPEIQSAQLKYNPQNGRNIIHLTITTSLKEEMNERILWCVKWLLKRYKIDYMFVGGEAYPGGIRLNGREKFSFFHENGKLYKSKPWTQVNSFDFWFERFMKSMNEDVWIWGIDKPTFQKKQLLAVKRSNSLREVIEEWFDQLASEVSKICRMIFDDPAFSHINEALKGKKHLEDDSILFFTKTHNDLRKENQIDFFKHWSSGLRMYSLITGNDNEQIINRGRREAFGVLNLLRNKIPQERHADLTKISKEIIQIIAQSKEKNELTDIEKYFFSSLEELARQHDLSLIAFPNFKNIAESILFGQSLADNFNTYQDQIWNLIESMIFEKTENRFFARSLSRVMLACQNFRNFLQLNITPSEYKFIISNRITPMTLAKDLDFLGISTPFDMSLTQSAFINAKNFYHFASQRGYFMLDKIKNWFEEYQVGMPVTVLLVTEGFLSKVIEQEMNPKLCNLYSVMPTIKDSQFQEIYQFYNYVVKNFTE